MGAVEGGDGVTMRRGNEEKIFVSVRLRPLNSKENATNDVSDWECINDSTILHKNDNVFMPDRSLYPTAYKFDRVFSSDCSTRQVYKEGVREVALSVVNGINSSIFAYGQTSSGKTYTMSGITEYTIADIYDYIKKHTEREYILKFSAMEIYNESVRDLLSMDSTPLRLLDDPERGTIVEKLTEANLRDWNHVRELLSVCEAQRQIGETALNVTSSRSHQIIRLTIESSARELSGKDNSSTLISAVNFIDLAGSERASQLLSSGVRLKEGNHINRSLLTLGAVIRKLSKGINGHVPYRDSKLTRILQSSLGGNARTAIICTISPARSHVEQSRKTLSFASSAKEVSTNAQVNVIISDKALVKHLQRELARLESDLSSPRSTFSDSKFSSLLREKDLKIEKLEKEVRDLTLQRDAAQSEVHNLLQKMGEEQCPPSREGISLYPHLRIHHSPDNEQIVQDYGRMSATSQFCDAYSVSSYNDSCVETPVIKVRQNDVPNRFLTSTSQYSESESIQDIDEIDERSNVTFEDAFQEIANNYFDPSCLSEDNTEISSQMADKELETERQKVVLPALQEPVVSLPLKEDRVLVSPFLKVNRQVSISQQNQDSELGLAWVKEGSKFRNSPFVIHSSEAPYPTHSYSNSIKGKTFNPGLSISLSSPWVENVENNEIKLPQVYRKDSISRPHGRLSSKYYGATSDGSDGAAWIGSEIEHKVCQQGASTSGNLSGDAEMKIDVEDQHDDHASEVATETEAESNGSSKSVKDVSLDKDIVIKLSDWPSEFKRLQREIVKLWDACNVSLVHRTHFFLLFKGDPSDCICMEIELRRLSFLKETFSHGKQSTQDGQILTLASSAKALIRERQMLSSQMQKQLSGIERENLFVEWAVPVDGKNRRLQLANRIWTDTEDMDHIARSANVVSKVVGPATRDKNLKEMFNINFANWGSKKTRSLRNSLTSIL